MGWVKGPGGSMKYVPTSLGSGSNVVDEQANIIERDGKKYRVHPSSRNLTLLDDHVSGMNKATPVTEGNTGIPVTSGSSGNVAKLRTDKIDFANTQQVSALQKAIRDAGIVGKDGEPLEIDGQFGPNTEHAYRQFINQRREAGGLDAYKYDGESSLLDKAEIITQPGQDGEYWDPKTNSWQETMTDYNPDLSLEDNAKVREDNKFAESLGLENEAKVVGYGIDGAPIFEGDETGGRSVLQPKEEEKSFGDQVYDYFNSWWNK